MKKIIVIYVLNLITLFLFTSCEKTSDEPEECVNSFLSFILPNNNWREENQSTDSIHIEYNPLTMEDEYHHLVYNNYYNYYFKGDTQINSKLYAKLYLHEVKVLYFNNIDFTPEDTIIINKIAGFIREDHCNRRVYFLDTTMKDEALLYDFSLEIGDTIKSYLFKDKNLKYSVYAKDTFRIGENCYPGYILEEHHETHSIIHTSIIEGVGFSDGFINIGYSKSFFNDIELYYATVFPTCF